LLLLLPCCCYCLAATIALLLLLPCCCCCFDAKIAWLLLEESLLHSCCFLRHVRVAGLVNFSTAWLRTLCCPPDTCCCLGPVACRVLRYCNPCLRGWCSC
jgi:hypothetical protein